MKKYPIETEIGNITPLVFRALHAKNNLFPTLGPKERLLSLSYQSLSMQFADAASYRQADALLNRVLHWEHEKEASLITFSDQIKREGQQLVEFQENWTHQQLSDVGYDEKTNQFTIQPETAVSNPVMMEANPEKAIEAMEHYNREKSGQERVDFTRIRDVWEMQEDSVYVSVDEIGVVKQKESRKEPDRNSTAKYVENSVAHIEAKEGSYILTSQSMRGLLLSVLAFLLSNGLLDNRRLIFFSDGARNIRNEIEKIFSFRPYQIILDWYHLKKKCEEYLSMGIRGKDLRNEVLEELLHYLWTGNIEYGTEFLLSLDEKKIKNRSYIDQLVAYLDKHYSEIPCYAVRKELGLRTSSNRVEKANDLAVGQRQKHNGMSWSKGGSGCLAQIRVMFLNGEEENWIYSKQLHFQLHCQAEGKSA